jgi:pimeloyl-ACP methyl ester carboxylesterase
VVLIHDHETTAFDTTPLFQSLTKAYNVMAIHLPGFGRSTLETPTRPPPSQDTVPFMSTFVYHFLMHSFKKSAIKKFVVVGFGTGAHVAADLVATYSELFTHALFCAPVGVFPALGTESLWWALRKKAVSMRELYTRYGGVVAQWAVFTLAYALGEDDDFFYRASIGFNAQQTWGRQALCSDMLVLGWGKALWTAPWILSLSVAHSRGVTMATLYADDSEVCQDNHGFSLPLAFCVFDLLCKGDNRMLKSRKGVVEDRRHIDGSAATHDAAADVQ